ncbi:S24 family peptidase [Pelistega ratti]|uniref:S24 family peptidase n=1 Tax=Pelistega ratti TaxID=2652177 RepID=UPI001FAA42C5|nr:S24 family peptidase [Pelistega ratti]
MKLKNEIRLDNLRVLISEAGNQVKLAELVGVAPSYINTLAKQRIDASTGKSKSIGESMARKLEVAMDKPYGWLDQDHSEHKDDVTDGYISLTYYDIQSSAGNGNNVEYFPAIKQITVLEDWANSQLGYNASKRIKLIQNKGVSMYPTIRDGDILMVDITCNRFDGDGIYIIAINDELFTKRLIRDIDDGSLLIVSDNQTAGYKTKRITKREEHLLTICAKVKKHGAFLDTV